jgi:hypothetical protein
VYPHSAGDLDPFKLAAVEEAIDQLRGHSQQVRGLRGGQHSVNLLCGPPLPPLAAVNMYNQLGGRAPLILFCEVRWVEWHHLVPLKMTKPAGGNPLRLVTR